MKPSISLLPECVRLAGRGRVEHDIVGWVSMDRSDLDALRIRRVFFDVRLS